MYWSELINEILDLKDAYPEELYNLYVEQDETYINKYEVGFNNIDNIDEYKDWDIYETMTVIDNNIKYDYNTKIIVYIKLKDNWLPLDVYYNKVINGLTDWQDGYMKAILRLLNA